VQTYGPLSGMLDDVGDPSVNGKSLTWTITGSSNGDPAVLEISVNGSVAQTVNLTGVGRFSQPFTASTANFEQDISLSVTLRDTSPGNRGSDSSSRRDQSGPPPAPAITLGRSACNDSSDSQAPACTFKGNPQSPITSGCTDATCGFLVIGTTDMNRRYTCSIKNSVQGDTSRTFDSNGQHVTDVYYRVGFVTVTCDEIGGNRDAGTTTWEWR